MSTYKSVSNLSASDRIELQSKMSSLKSKYWTYYLKMPARQAQCNLCMQVIKTGGSTTNLRNHLKYKHKEHFDLLDFVVMDNAHESKLHDIPLPLNEADPLIEVSCSNYSETKYSKLF